MAKGGRVGLIILLAAMLTACEKKAWTHDEIQDIADDVAADAVADSERVRELEGRIEEIERKLNMQQASINANASLANAVADQVSLNAKVANDNVLADATKRGACGTRMEYGPGQPSAWIRPVNIECTRKNYFKKN